MYNETVNNLGAEFSRPILNVVIVYDKQSKET